MSFRASISSSQNMGELQVMETSATLLPRTLLSGLRPFSSSSKQHDDGCPLHLQFPFQPQTLFSVPTVSLWHLYHSLYIFSIVHLHVLIPLSGRSFLSPYLDFNTLNLTNTIGKYLHIPSANYTTTSPGCLYTPPKNGIPLPTVYILSDGEISSDGLTSGRCSCGSGIHSPLLVHSIPYTSVPITSTPSLPPSPLGGRA